MNRFAPLIIRRVGPMAAFVPFTAVPGARPAAETDGLKDLKQFALGWVGGLVFFGTFLA